ncbi:MAG TPA: hypothetical protein VKQ07_00460 [Jatrophihabitantaceae bacterium]|jgi:hypothetical protein|nr:hypothetical protein [Jatrophihabitantaceae bacterium]
MYSQFSAMVAEERRRQLVAEASNARMAKQLRDARPRVRRQRRRLGTAWLKPLFDVSATRPTRVKPA